MDSFASDRKLSELGVLDLQDFLMDGQTDLFDPAAGQSSTVMTSRHHQHGSTDFSMSMSYKVDSGWLDNFLDDSSGDGVAAAGDQYGDVLSAAGLDDVMQQQQQPVHVKSEHSYSMADAMTSSSSSITSSVAAGSSSAAEESHEVDFDIKTEADEMDMDGGLFSLIDPHLTLLDDDSEVASTAAELGGMGEEERGIAVSSSSRGGVSHRVTSSSAASALLLGGRSSSPGTAVVFRRPASTAMAAFSSGSLAGAAAGADVMMSTPVSIKTEPLDLTACTSSSASTSDEDAVFTTIESDFLDVSDPLDLPPTPPSSSSCSSDSEGGELSPIHLPSYMQQTRTHHISFQHHHQPGGVSAVWTSSSSSSSSSPHSVFTSTIPSSGILVLSEEEKRTLVAEGYPIPNKLPLTKQEEKNLKKIRRKIKNKISAQESRRKKKEYLEHLEKRVEFVSMENITLRKKLDSLESNNRSLTSQLQKLQSIASRVTAEMQAATCITVS